MEKYKIVILTDFHEYVDDALIDKIMHCKELDKYDHDCTSGSMFKNIPRHDKDFVALVEKYLETNYPFTMIRPTNESGVNIVEINSTQYTIILHEGCVEQVISLEDLKFDVTK